MGIAQDGQKTLGEFIDLLVAQPGANRIIADMPIEEYGEIEGTNHTPGEFTSYRGDYADLSICPGEGKTTAEEMVRRARACLGKVFHGWKGGDFEMGKDTIVWMADSGAWPGRAVTDVVDAGYGVTLIYTAPEEF